MVHRKSNNNNTSIIVNNSMQQQIQHLQLHHPAKMQPFLRKLKLIIETVPNTIAGWDETGTVFEVLDVNGFANELKKHYKGSEQTFIRQLHFYSFTKSDCTRNLRQVKNMPPALPGSWSFSHPLMLKNAPELMSGIQRQDKKETEESENEEINQLRQSVKSLEKALSGVSSKLSTIMNVLERAGFDLSKEIVDNNHNDKLSSTSFINKRPRFNNDDDIDNKEEEKERSIRIIENNDENSKLDSFFQDYQMNNKFERFDTINNGESSSLAPLELQRNYSIPSFVPMDLNIDDLAESLSHGMSFDEGLMMNPISPIPSSLSLNKLDNDIKEEEPLSTNAAINTSAGINNLNTTSAMNNNNNKKQDDIDVDPSSLAKVIVYLRAAITAAASASPSASNNINNSNAQDASKPLPLSRSHSLSLRLPQQQQLQNEVITTNTSVNNNNNNNPEISTQQMASLLPLLLSLPQIQLALSTISSTSKVINSSSLSTTTTSNTSMSLPEVFSN